MVHQYKLIETNKDTPVNLNSIDEIRQLYDNLVSKEVADEDVLDGEIFRKGFVGVQNQSDGEYVHAGVTPETKIIEYLSEMLFFIKYYEAPASFKIMASHYIFEYIHPFYDGNGRVGRFIIAKLLSDYYDNYTALTFSYVINRNKGKYYRAFVNASNKYNQGDLTRFIEDMLDLLIEGQERVINDLLPKIKSVNDLNEKFLDLNRFTEIEGKFLFYLSIDKMFGDKRSRLTLKDLEELLNVGRAKLNTIVEKNKEHLIKVKGNPVIYEISTDYINFIKSS